MNGRPFIIAIDDDEAEVRPKISSEFRLEVVDPTVGDDQFANRLAELVDRASLILLDHKFWDQPPPLSLRASDGASFVAHLRSWARINRKQLAPVVIFTNEQEAFANEIPSVGASAPIGGSFLGREYQLAPTLDLEWIQYKQDDRATDRISALARAFIAASEAGGPDGASIVDIENLLRMPTEPVWTDLAREELHGARAPVNHKAGGAMEPTRGPSQIVRWLCHRALPFPGLLFSDLYAAWAIGLSLASFRALAAADLRTDWLVEFRRCEYKGPLDQFLGRRWWRAGIDQLVWQLDEEAERKGGRKQAFTDLAPSVEIDEPRPRSSYVVCWTEDFREGDIVPIDQAVQLHPPGWPAEALEPWVSKEEVARDPILTAMSDPVDLR
jgi:hypothetical protein